MEQHRQELSNAEKLFDLPITNYPGILEVDRDIRNISKVYELYAAQKVSKTSQLDFIAVDELEFLISQPCCEPKNVLKAIMLFLIVLLSRLPVKSGPAHFGLI